MRNRVSRTAAITPVPAGQGDLFAVEIAKLPMEPITVRIPTAIRLTGIGRSKIYELIKAGEIETVKIGTSTLLKVESLRRLVACSR